MYTMLVCLTLVASIAVAIQHIRICLFIMYFLNAWQMFCCWLCSALSLNEIWVTVCRHFTNSNFGFYLRFQRAFCVLHL